jgi:hypothetical protein
MGEEEVPLLPSEPQHVDAVVPARLLVIRYFGALAFVVLVGVAAWWVTNHEEESDFINPDQEKKWWLIQLLGWSSALLFVRAYHTLPSATIASHFRFSSEHGFRKYVRSPLRFFFACA